MERKNILITGSSRGIGRACALAFAKNGWYVFINCRSSLDQLKETESMILASGGACTMLPGDAGNPDDVRAMFDKISSLCGGLDVLVNNAGINTIAPLDALGDGVLDEMLQVNLKAPLQIVRALGGRIGGSRTGRIVNLSSIWAFVSKEGRCGYTAAKAAVRGVTQTLALELAPRNILVNAVAPGFVDTELTRRNNTPEQIAALAETIPLARLAAPEEIAELIGFLASERNTYITGQTLVIDGGYTCR